MYSSKSRGIYAVVDLLMINLYLALKAQRQRLKSGDYFVKATVNVLVRLPNAGSVNLSI
jgi:hypothetical protein